MKKCATALFVCLMLITACKTSTERLDPELIVGRWTRDAEANVQYIMEFTAEGKWTWRSIGRFTTHMGGTYMITESTLRCQVTGENRTDVYDIVILTEKRLRMIRRSDRVTAEYTRL